LKTKFIFPFLFFVFCTANLFAQASDWQWARSSASGDTIGSGWNRSVCSDAAGNIYVTGYFYNSTITFGSTTFTNTSDSGYTADIYLVKYDANGNVLWAKNATGPGEDVSTSVCTDDSGNVFIGGWFTGALIVGSVVLPNAGGVDLFIAKFDGNGNVIWAKRDGGPYDDWAFSVNADASGNLFVTGIFSSPTISFGSTILTNADPSGHTNDIFIAKYNSNGNALWAKRAGGIDDDQCNSVSTDANGNAFITGCFRSLTITFGATTLTNWANSNNYNLFIAKYDASGNEIWAKSAITAFNGESEGKSVSTDASGNIFLTGKFFSPTIIFDADTLITIGNVDAFIVKYDTNGNVIWAKSGGGISYDEGLSISVGSGGNVFVVGSYISDTIAFDSTILTKPVGIYDPLFLLKYDTNGNLLCASALAAQGDFYSVAADLFGNAYAVGTFVINPFIVGSDSLTLVGWGDAFVAKYNCGNVETVNEFNNEEPISIFPNPSNGIFILKWDMGQWASDKGKNCEIEIYNSLGEIIYGSKINSSSSTIDLSNEASGIYFVNVKAGEKSFTQKIIIE
jgi:hypothetical protein